MSIHINVIKDKILSENYFVLRNITYDLTQRDGQVVQHKREVYDRGNGATVLLYNSQKTERSTGSPVSGCDLG
ncbi:GDP-mannose pyrophosphatase nudK [Kluyvera cryocrescens]|uniref:GDP-mannose pyrophosphatase nudK n=1 Tax=Kluyvera cryocrescens TaxID=580 RepID=A0A485ATW4_KLUCR|nr:GDP-mannose pyrophosphatase nudK [Kluyvera cryocrescens]